MIYLQQFNYIIEYQIGKRMSHVDYLSRNPINEVENPEEVAFVKNIAHEVTKFNLAFIYNYYGLIMSIWIEEHIKGLYQISYEKWEPQDKMILDLMLRELKEKTGLVIASEKAKWVGIDKFYDCAIYTIEFRNGEVLR